MTSPLLIIAKRVGASFFNLAKFTAKTYGSLAVGAGALLVYDQNVGCLRSINGPSMTPTFNDYFDNYKGFTINKQVIVNDIVYFSRNTKKIERGDIVLFKRPKTNTYIVKRVVCLPGDTVTPVLPGGAEGEPVQLGEGQLWVESDAGLGHADSNFFGALPREAVEGIAQICIAPHSSTIIRRLYNQIPKHVEGRIHVPSIETEQVQTIS